MKKPLGTDVEELRADFASVRGVPFAHYYCPILHVDEPVALCRGHVVPKSVGGRAMVLQREDVDNGFGDFFEAEAGDAIKHGLGRDDLLERVLSGDPDEVKEIRRRFKIETKLRPDGDPIKVDARKVDGETQFFVKPEYLDGIEGRLRAEFGVGLDARSSILVTALKASHLCWFRKEGYAYVFSNEGLVVAWALRSFYEEFIAPRRGPNRRKRGSLISEEVKDEVNQYCSQFANFIRPVLPRGVATLSDEIRAGTLDSGAHFVLWDGDDVYGRISFVKLGKTLVSVLTPVITDARGWALLNLAADFELEYSAARWSAERGRLEVAPPSGAKLVWPRANWSAADLEARARSPLTIREAAEAVTRSGL